MPARSAVRRRTVLAGALGAASLLVSGCDHGDDLAAGAPGGSAKPHTGGASGSLSASPTADQSPDEQLVDSVGQAIAHAVEVLFAARRFPALRPAVQPVLKAHRKHLAVLETGASLGTLPVHLSSPAQALQVVRQTEHQLQVTLAAAAGRAESGALARLLASISASVTQYVGTLPAAVGT